MNIGQDVFDSFVFHDAVFKAISFDVEAEKIKIVVENETEKGNLLVLTVVFNQALDFSFNIGDFLRVSEISSARVTTKEGSSYFEMIVSLGFGEPSGELSFSFSTFEAIISE